MDEFAVVFSMIYGRYDFGTAGAIIQADISWKDGSWICNLGFWNSYITLLRNAFHIFIPCSQLKCQTALSWPKHADVFLNFFCVSQSWCGDERTSKQVARPEKDRGRWRSKSGRRAAQVQSKCSGSGQRPRLLFPLANCHLLNASFRPIANLSRRAVDC